MKELLISKKAKGFTLIELVIALAIFVVITLLVFSSLSSFFKLRSAYGQEMVLQQNFRFAIDRITEDFRQARKDPTKDGDIIILPNDLSEIGEAMGEVLAFRTDTYVSPTETSYKGVKYYIQTSGNTSVLYREVFSYDPDYYNSDPLSHIIGSPEVQPLTEEIRQLVKIYFVRSIGKIGVIIVGKTNYFGKERVISFTSVIYSRNSNNEILPP
jgi:prepilin-type N-terminal cleavage/methylation domain-containing protein